MDSTDELLATARDRLDDTLATLSGGGDDPALLLAARNAIVALGGLARSGAPPMEMDRARRRTSDAVKRFLERDPGDALAFPLLDARAAALAEVVRVHGDLAHIDDVDDRQNWTEEAYEIFAARDAVDAWFLGAAALLRWLDAGPQRENLERVRERAVQATSRFDRALEPALDGLSPLRAAARTALARGRADDGYVRRARYWVRLAGV